MTRRLVAVNTAPDSENKMHGDEARRFGFAGGLVPGVDVLAYPVTEAVGHVGPAWLGAGRLTGRLDAPVYDGEDIGVRVVGDDMSGLATEVVGADGTVRARVTLDRLDEGAVAAIAERDPASFAVCDPPPRDERPPASRAQLRPGTPLATLRAGFHADRAGPYLAEISEVSPVFTDPGVAHPGWLLRFANWVLADTVRLGPWIHVSSDLRLAAPVADGDVLEVRAVVTDAFERKGHEFVDLEALYLVEGRPVAVCEHRAIWRPRPAPP